MAEKSIADLLRASIENAPVEKPLDIQVPLYNPPLFMRLKKVKDATAVDAAMTGIDDIKQDAPRALEQAVRLLLLACDHVFVVMDGKEHPLGGLGCDIYGQIFPEADPKPVTDVEAVYALYTDPEEVCDTVAITSAAIRYAEWRSDNTLLASEATLGESRPGVTRRATSRT